MKSKIFVACMAMALAAGCAAAHAESAEAMAPVKFSHAELLKMEREARTVLQYQALATYFRSRQQEFEQQAQSEKAEWDRRSQNVTSTAAKYPRPVDSSKNRYDYLTYRAQQMSQQAAHYESLASNK